MNTDYAPVEMASYVIRRPNGENGKKEEKQIYKKQWLWTAGIVLAIALIAGSWYGIVKQASANETEDYPAMEAEVMETAPVQQPAETKVADENTVTEDETLPYINVISGDELIAQLAKKEISAEHEERLSGLSWNHELIADIKNRKDAEDELFYGEDYRELLVTMGMDANHASQDPELPEYLKKTYNPLMDIDVTEDELDNLLRLVEAEAPSEDIYGKILVANVVLNRVNCEDEMANTINGVIFEKVGGNPQFSPTTLDWYWESLEISDVTKEAVARCLSGEDYSEGALYFYAWEKRVNKRKKPAWMSDLEEVFIHGGHCFLREPDEN